MKGRLEDWGKREINGIEGEGMEEKKKERVLEEGAGNREKDQIKEWAGWEFSEGKKGGYPK